jgi:hypothetical protein
MNRGERDELIAQIKVIDLRKRRSILGMLGEVRSVRSVMTKREYSDLPGSFNFRNLTNFSNEQLQHIAHELGIRKAGTSYKADSLINDIPISIKSMNHAPPALVNHTTRPGFERIAKLNGGNILLLDEIIDEYWRLRQSKLISEDLKNNNPLSPFKNKKELLRPFLNYFLFKGTGSKTSVLPAKYILSFTDPTNTISWKLHDESNAVDLYWIDLIFSIRAKKGMPSGYPDKMSRMLAGKKPSIDRWTKYIDSEYRGALHIRTK